MEKRIKNFEKKLKTTDRENKENLKTENFDDKIIEEEERESKLSIDSKLTSPKNVKSEISINSKNSKISKTESKKES
jgi:hypothetical protein